MVQISPGVTDAGQSKSRGNPMWLPNAQGGHAGLPLHRAISHYSIRTIRLVQHPNQGPSRVHWLILRLFLGSEIFSDPASRTRQTCSGKVPVQICATASWCAGARRQGWFETLKRASSLNSRLTGKLSTCDFSRDRVLRICSRISLILWSSGAMIVNQILKASSRR